jgi:anhydro-N-acetylmuramic acid kinase
METYHALGIMSGTSLDGLDLALCRFTCSGKHWTHAIDKATTVPYPDRWFRRLGQAHTLNAHSFLVLHKEFGRFMGEQVNAFLSDPARPDLVASHGHTLFHTPSLGLTFQIGDGATLAATCGITTICDFRSLDVALGGQGAPLVPAGDEMLFGNYDFCLNLGGFANISFRKDNRRIAYDICPVNSLLNPLSRRLGLPFDEDGKAGRSGKIIDALLAILDSNPYYQSPPPKSLGREWLEQNILPHISTEAYSIPDLLRTVYQHAAGQISSNLTGDPSGNVLVTGGGAYNRFLLELIRQNTRCNLVLPDDRLIQFKEALIFAFLGVLRMRNEINCLASVTGARQDSSSGVVYIQKKSEDLEILTQP